MEIDDLTKLTGKQLTYGGRLAVEPAERPSLRRPRRKEPAIYAVRVDLEHAKPPIWRRLDVRSDVGLDAFHQVLQAAFSWTDSHLHRFAIGGSPFDRKAEQFLCPYDVEEAEEDEGTPAIEVTLDETLSEPGDVLRYCYDYGDSWDLTIALESIRALDDSAPPPLARCIDGRRSAPPEDCGGLRDAADLAEVLDDPTYFDLDDINEALADPYMQLLESSVNPRLVDLLNRLRSTEIGEDLVGRVLMLSQPGQPEISREEKAAALHPFLWFLDRVGDDGLPVTSAGYLKPEDVLATAAVIPDMADWIGTANRESHTFPVLQFRESLRKLGLVRKHRGRLVLTKGGSAVRGDPDRLWRHLAVRLPLGNEKNMEIPAGLLALVFVASSPGEPTPFEPIAWALTDLGWREADRQPISASAASWATADTFGVLENIRLEPRGRGRRGQLSVVAGQLARDSIWNHDHAK